MKQNNAQNKQNSLCSFGHNFILKSSIKLKFAATIKATCLLAYGTVIEMILLIYPHNDALCQVVHLIVPKANIYGDIFSFQFLYCIFNDFNSVLHAR